MSRTIHIDLLDPGSVQNAIRQLEDYKRWVQSKAEELRRRVAEFIRDQAEPVFQSAVADNRYSVVDGSAVDDTQFGNVTVEVEHQGDNLTLVIASGEDAVFMEFGAGVYYNGSVGSYPNPLAQELDFISAIGTYGEGHGARETWGFRGKDGEIHLTHGTPASMPLYKAVQSVRQDLIRIAREVFST